ncbi:MAG: YdaU family protein [bacterium]|jgi:uncharacterized protein YdaU (DUF1376 family)
MYYYQFHIGDYQAAAFYLSNEEDLAYRRLLDMYYDTEKPIPNDIQWLSRRLRLGSDVVLSVLKDMFEETPEGWRNKRADEQIREYHAFIAKQSANGKLGGRPRKTQAKPTANPEQTQTKAKKSLTTNHKPISKKEYTPQVASMFPDVSPEVVSDFVRLRKSLRAPITELAVKGIRREAEKAGLSVEAAMTMCIERSWRGFKAEWVRDRNEPKGFDWETELRGAI